MKKILITSLLVLLGLSAGWVAVTRAGEGIRTDCPGRIDCPLTGDRVCADQCPLRTE